jgi:hypothetical protein
VLSAWCLVLGAWCEVLPMRSTVSWWPPKRGVCCEESREKYRGAITSLGRWLREARATPRVTENGQRCILKRCYFSTSRWWQLLYQARGDFYFIFLGASCVKCPMSFSRSQKSAKTKSALLQSSRFDVLIPLNWYSGDVRLEFDW